MIIKLYLLAQMLLKSNDYLKDDSLEECPL